MSLPNAEGPVSILIVDDRPNDAMMLSEVLSNPAYEIVVANSGPAALKRVLTQDFALILMDVVMPEMDGFEVASVIKQRERSRHTPIVFLTAAGQDVRAIYQAYSVGAVDYLSKPLDEVIVRAKVAIFADLFRKDRRIREQAAALLEADRRERELQLSQMRVLSEKRYRSLLEMIPASIWTADRDGQVDYCNHRWRESTTMHLDQTCGTGWLQAVHPEDATRAAELWRRAVETDEDYVGEIRLRARDGHRWHICHVMADREPGGRVRGWVAMFADCQELKAAIEVRDEFLSIASHELRTPLSTLMLQLDSLQRTLRDLTGADDRSRHKVDSALRQTQRLDKLVSDLLDVSRICMGRLELDRDEVDMVELARTCVEGFGEQAKRTGTTIDFHADGVVMGRWDRMRMEQVITNLLSNAVKYGAGKPVHVSVGGDRTHATIQVRDQGIGIASEAQARIFERFERAVSSRHYGGLGIGLYVTRQIVEAHGGTIGVTSRSGEGSVFTVDVPGSADDRAGDIPRSAVS